jgi:CSLREA domain-containing protein
LTKTQRLESCPKGDSPMKLARSRHSIVVLTLVLATVSIAVLLASQSVRSAGPFTINSLGDSPDAVAGDGACDDGVGNCTLRAAI